MKQPPAIEPTPSALLAEPLSWLSAEHDRHRQYCRLVEEVALAPVVMAEAIQELMMFFHHDLPLHIRDEEEDLFALLRQRCAPEDDLERILDNLSADHRSDMDTIATLRGHLEAALRRRQPISNDPEVQRLFIAFVAHERNHVALENAVILPIARLRLTQADLDRLCRRMVARRGLPVLPDRTSGDRLNSHFDQEDGEGCHNPDQE